MDIAFIGLGHMGGPMAVNLVTAGHRVTGFDLVSALNEAAAAHGVVIAESAAAAARDVDIVITMLQQGQHVIDAYQGSPGMPGLLASARAGTLFIDSSTIAVADARAVHGLAQGAGFRSLDAPVSGGVMGAEAGTLAFMVGGSDEDFATAEPVLQVMGRRIVHCGGPGLGQAAKVCNNLILGISMIGVSEAFVLGERLGLAHQALFDVASNASGQCWALTTNCPVPGPVSASPANNDYRPGFSGALMAKDLGLAEHAIVDAGIHAELGLLAAAVYRRFAAEGGGGLDFSAIIEDIRAHSGAPGESEAMA
ncbi:MAG: 3-hydroxyisobutyrate dehydrogenase [Microbacteriaceae bacterium]|nr:3-hydroxyisobutyrate dehydrogenase [Microbacteriaceae bacterium]MCL2794158.1 3-hydroxyisobutyrate dehydrogenase [Microbacteriaceae bacterium]